MNTLQRIAIAALWVYKRTLSPLLHTLAGPSGGCRFYPTCSDYASEAVQRHGLLKGSALAIHRVCRCHPWGACGEDPVPQEFSLVASRKGTAP